MIVKCSAFDCKEATELLANTRCCTTAFRLRDRNTNPLTLKPKRCTRKHTPSVCAQKLDSRAHAWKQQRRRAMQPHRMMLVLTPAVRLTMWRHKTFPLRARAPIRVLLQTHKRLQASVSHKHLCKYAYLYEHQRRDRSHIVVSRHQSYPLLRKRLIEHRQGSCAHRPSV